MILQVILIIISITVIIIIAKIIKVAIIIIWLILNVYFQFHNTFTQRYFDIWYLSFYIAFICLWCIVIVKCAWAYYVLYKIISVT